MIGAEEMQAALTGAGVAGSMVAGTYGVGYLTSWAWTEMRKSMGDNKLLWLSFFAAWAANGAYAYDDKLPGVGELARIPGYTEYVEWTQSTIKDTARGRGY